jgi:hypothetical protein
MEEFLPDCRGHLRNRRYEFQSDEFAIINDEAHHFTFLNYYIAVDAQVNQACAIGFEDIEVYDMSGNLLTETDYITCGDPWVYYVCYKRADGDVASAG